MAPRAFACFLLPIAALAACTSTPTPTPPNLGIRNGTALTVTLVVNGRPIGEFEPGGNPSIDVAALPALPVAGSRSGPATRSRRARPRHRRRGRRATATPDARLGSVSGDDGARRFVPRGRRRRRPRPREGHVAQQELAAAPEGERPDHRSRCSGGVTSLIGGCSATSPPPLRGRPSSRSRPSRSVTNGAR